ncbi:MAG: Aspartate kinase Ask_LysC [Phycisphaerae bacterium]|nr:Aspartate kinase Ask_LysC [Phycisphaerae bacterium]
MGLVVQKFGGTSVADATKIHRAARRAIKTKLDGNRVVMVVSAMGHTTDHLLALAKQITHNPPHRELDVLLTTGEQVSIALMAMAIAEAGERAISLTAAQVGLVTDSVHSRARIKHISKERIEAELQAERIVIVAGFQGIDPVGEITTLGRGASDTTAVALAAVLGADHCEIYTDVDGIYSANPRLVPQARKMDQISYDEMLEMASLGAEVMHSRAIEFGKKYSVPIHVRSSFTDNPGTMIVESTPGMEDVVVRGATLKEDLATVVFTDIPNEPGVAARIFSRIADNHIVVDDIMQNVHSGGTRATIGFSMLADDLPAIRNIAEILQREIHFGGAEITEGVSKVSVIGIGMRSHSGVAQKMFEALAESNINIRHISTSEIVISCIINSTDGQKALLKLHNAFALDTLPISVN